MTEPQSAILPVDARNGRFILINLRQQADFKTVAWAAAGFPELLAEAAAAADNAPLYGALAFGPACWAELAPTMPVADFHPFAGRRHGARIMPATGGDLFLHLHGARSDLLYDLARAFVTDLDDCVDRVDETVGFVYRDNRDLTGFIDGTENPQGDERAEVALLGADAGALAGGSFLMTQRYVHNLRLWSGLSQQAQEQVIGRSKPDSVELSDEKKPPSAHISRVVIEEDGEELEILRHSMPYGQSAGPNGLFFLAYSNQLRIFDAMLDRMIGGDDGLYDHLLQYSNPVSGGYFFAPPLPVLSKL